eukprot:gnl/TRDRNA2_/TRDRNA2_202887_c0_seq1.p1 gnl/TRDRNA2_/TRDRNA2_202887_c0~~gnl/TRDRNA2_/TRDRNA2_202887_c0_seq1.p1  ORF type:complete len:341 (+),score=69.68 gnl/TRDRNA2_/TRDRNA2_202887_c0_seq1:34-1056(+)
MTVWCSVQAVSAVPTMACRQWRPVASAVREFLERERGPWAQGRKGWCSWANSKPSVRVPYGTSACLHSIAAGPTDHKASVVVPDGHAESVISTLEKIYNAGPMYGELTQFQHGLQCAECARKAGKDDLFIVAALLHDVGWMLAAATNEGQIVSNEKCENEVSGAIISDRAPKEDCLAAQLGILAHVGVEGAAGESAGEEQRRAQHDVIGATWLRMQGFHEKIPHLVEGHVLAKRYLVSADDGYAAKLSNASVRTLAYQGGKMTAEEMKLFEQDPLHEDCKLLRTMDEGAKIKGLQVPGFETHKDRIAAALVRPPTTADKCFSQTYIREGNTIVGLRECMR